MAALLGVALAMALLGPARPAAATMSMGAWFSYSEDDISGFTTLSGNDTTATATMPFSVTIEGVNYSTVTISTNGWLEFGGNTQGTSDNANACIPTSKHTNPFLAFYWDDMQTDTDNIRYGSSGSSPNRTYVIDFQLNRVASSGDQVHGQVEIHEKSNVINVRYRNPISAAANGQSATIGFQGAGGSSATARPLTCNGKILDDNRPDEGWSVAAGSAGLLPLFAVMEHSPDDINSTNIPGLQTLSGDNTTAGVTLPFSITLEGTAYSTLTIGTNGVIVFGTTTGSNPTANASLPTSSFTHPVLAYYWDDLQTEGSNIRYGTVGSSPNRTFIVDFQENRVAATGDKVNGQVQIHEKSNLINVKYRSTLSAGANGQTATIGFQGDGGAAAVAYPLTFNGKILDDDRPDDGWSVFPLPLGAMVVHATTEYSPNDISGFTSLSGNDTTATASLPFSFNIDGTNYTSVVISTNGWLEFGSNTQGTSDNANASLPTSKHTNPFLAYYWDDLQTFSSNILYATVGSSPNRTFIVDFQENRVGDTGNVVNGQVQLHEKSNVISVRYRSTMSAGANGQAATIGFQAAGGSSATAYPLTFNGKILDDNRPDMGWSVSPMPICGNGVVETQEDCDQGAANGTTGSCCTATCTFKSAGAVCRAAAGECDLQETCSGSGATCPADAKKTAGTACTDDGNPCSLDQCDGTSVTCQHPAGNAGAVCRATAGSCDVAETCTGTSTACPADGFAPATQQCRAVAGNCDVAEFCTGGGPACPADSFVPAGSECRAAAGVCDVAESCTGSGPSCPPDQFAPATMVCRSVAGDCDVAETCTGGGPSCPPDGFAPATQVCRAAAGTCDVAESCTGSGAACPPDAVEPAGHVCRAAAGTCDVGETCDGTSVACPADAFAPATQECRASAGVCDVAEDCTGSSAACPADAFAPTTQECRAAAGVCDVAEHCTGSGASCPADGFAPSTEECRAAAGPCDAAESCTGSGPDCPPDALAPAGQECRAAAGACDVAETCTGTSVSCPPDGFALAGMGCRPAAGTCDVGESCDGLGPACPPDVLVPSGVVCRPTAGVCDAPESCTGTAPGCPPDAFTSAGGAFVCRPAAGPCDVAESCDGSGTDCPTDQKSSAVCRPSAGACDVAESCDGVSDLCPADQKSTGVCRPAAGPCDFAESCDGSSNACPPDGVAADGTSCDDGNSCTAPDTCQGGACSGTPDPDGCIDDFLCYKTKLGTPFTAISNVHLVDTFDPDAHFDLVKAQDVCTPADKNSEGRLDTVTHERAYKLKPVAGAPRFVKVTHIGTQNQLGPLVLDATKPDLLLVPTAKNVAQPPPPLGPNNVDHYKCYKTVVTRGTPKFVKTTVTVSDQFRMTPGQFDVKKPRHFCTPVSKNGEPVHNPDGYLICYLARPSHGQPKHIPVAPVYVRDQFGPATIATVREDELCIPTVRVP